MSKERRELEASLVARDQVLDRWQTVYTAVGDILSGFYRLAGKDKLASQIRPTTRRVRGETVVGEGGNEQAPEGTGEDNLNPTEAVEPSAETTSPSA